VIKFSTQRSGQVELDLTSLNADADLYLVDSEGDLLARSTRPGRAAESISADIDAGDFYVAVVARTFWSNSYRLTVSATLSDPLPANPLEEITQPDSGTPIPNGQTDNVVSPLTQVANFGGTRDWNVNAIGAPEAWAAGFLGQGVTVAVVDTGVDLDHPDLVSNLFVNPGEIPGNGIDDDGNGYVDDVHGYDFADDDSDPNDVGGHGTHVAGTIAAANNGFGATGIAHGATILPVRVLGASGSGSSFDVAAGIRYAADLGADVINLSLGGGYSRAIQSAINYASSLGTFIVAAAGNEASSVPSFPAQFSANYENVISVGAHQRSGSLARFSNRVGNSDSVQIDAPGVGIFSTYVGGGYASLSGTSMAAPHVAGLAALTLSANPDLTSQELRDLLATGVTDPVNGSDSLGTASTLNTVAYAAAGLSQVTSGQGTVASDARGTLGQSNQLTASNRRVNTTATSLVGLISTPFIASSQTDFVRSFQSSNFAPEIQPNRVDEVMKQAFAVSETNHSHREDEASENTDEGNSDASPGSPLTQPNFADFVINTLV
jgi:subtilisin family serine protease